MALDADLLGMVAEFLRPIAVNDDELALDAENRLYKSLLASYQEPAMDPAAKEALTEFVEHRKREGGVPTDF